MTRGVTTVLMASTLFMAVLAADARAQVNSQDLDSQRGEDAADVAGTELFQDLLEQLQNKRFAVRQRATQQLERLGMRGLATLEQATRLPDADARSRALGVIEEHYREGENEQIREQAQRTLEQIAERSDAAGRAAHLILHPPETPAVARRFLQRVPAVRVLAAAQPAVRVQQVQKFQIISQRNGQKIRIASQGEGIEVEITEQREGKEVTEKFQVKNADELKQRHPQAHEIFQRFRGDQAGAAPLLEQLRQTQAQIEALKQQWAQQDAAAQQRTQAKIDALERLAARFAQTLDQLPAGR